MSKRAPQGAGQPPEALVKAVRKVLRPLVRLMLSYQITYPFVVATLKALYVEVADREFSVEGKRQSDSRINLLTGVHRKDVKRLRQESAETAAVPSNISIGAQVIAHWLGSPEFQDNQGNPRPLALRHGETDEQPTFDELVERVCRQDIRPRVILDDWLNLGVGHLDEQQRVILNTGAFTPEQGFEEKAFFFGKNIQDHINAGSDNLLAERAPHFDRSVYYDRLSAESVEKLDRLARDVGMQALRRINSEALALQQQDRQRLDESGQRYRINFGVFHYNTDYRGQDGESADDDKPKGNDHA